MFSCLASIGDILLLLRKEGERGGGGKEEGKGETL